MVFVGRGWGWALIKFLDFQGGHLFKGGCLLTFWAFRVKALIRGGCLYKGG